MNVSELLIRNNVSEKIVEQFNVLKGNTSYPRLEGCTTQNIFHKQRRAFCFP